MYIHSLYIHNMTEESMIQKHPVCLQKERKIQSFFSACQLRLTASQIWLKIHAINSLVDALEWLLSTINWLTAKLLLLATSNWLGWRRSKPKVAAKVKCGCKGHFHVFGTLPPSPGPTIVMQNTFFAWQPPLRHHTSLFAKPPLGGWRHYWTAS